MTTAIIVGVCVFALLCGGISIVMVRGGAIGDRKRDGEE